MSSRYATLPPWDHSAEIKQTESLDPTWTYGRKVDATPEGRKWLEGEKEGWKVFDTATEDPTKIYHLMDTAIVPRPIAFVSSISESGIENLSPFSWFNMSTQYPPVITISFHNVQGPTQRPKDTPRNIKATKGFTVNIISEPWAANAHAASLDAPEEINEWELSGLTKEKSLHVIPARVKESAVSMECELFQSVPIVHPVTGEETTTLILGLVKYIHVRKDVLTERDAIDAARMRHVGKMGGDLYARIGDRFALSRQVWKTEGEQAQEYLKSLH